MLTLASCDLMKSLDEYEPLYSLPAETAITGEPTAELALAGLYSGFRQEAADQEILKFILSGLYERISQGSFYYNTRPEFIGGSAIIPF